MFIEFYYICTAMPVARNRQTNAMNIFNDLYCRDIKQPFQYCLHMKMNILIVACLLTALSSAAQYRELTVTTAGSLPDMIPLSEKYTITELKLKGQLNGTDFRFLREMAGADVQSEPTNGKLKSLDLTDCRIVRGGEPYLGMNLITRTDTVTRTLFQHCTALEVLKLPSTVKVIETFGLGEVPHLKAIEVPASVTEIGVGAFWKCADLETAVLPDELTTISHDAFRYCYKLQNVHIPAKVAAIKSYAFEGCKSLKNIVLPEGLKMLGNSVFANCESLEHVNLPSSLDGIGNGLFRNTSITEITVPKSITDLSEQTFCDCKKLQKVNILGEVGEFDGNLFDGCEALKELHVASSVPPIVGVFTFRYVDYDSCAVYVKEPSLPSYRAAWDWNRFKNLQAESGTTAVMPAATVKEATEVARFSMDGSRINRPISGINIVKMSDGNVKKVFVE